MSLTKWQQEIAPFVKLLNKSHGENDEGDYDYYSKFELVFNRTGEDPVVIWSGGCHRGSNCSYAWGQEMCARLSPDAKQLHVQVTEVQESIGSAQNKRGEEKMVNVPKELLERGLITAAQFEDAQTPTGDGVVIAPSDHAKDATWQLHSDPWA